MAGNTVPDVARHANLTADLLSGSGHDRSSIPHHLDQNEVATINKRTASPNSYFSIIAPRSAEDWNYNQKGRYITSRYQDDCRPALSEPVDHIFPKGNDPTITPADPEILDTNIFSPPWIIHKNSEEARLDWNNAIYDAAGHKQCESLFKLINENDARLDFWRAFALDPKKIRVTSVNHVVSAICHDDVTWFINYIKEPHRTVIVKTDASGEIVYKISFPTPDDIDNSSGAITQSTLRSEGGYVYFEWWNFHLPANKIVIVRKMKIRLAEPQTHGREKHN